MLRRVDYEATLDCVGRLWEARESSVHLLPILTELVPADLAEWHTCDVVGGVSNVCRREPIPTQGHPDEYVWRIWRQSPLFIAWRRSGAGVHVLSDYATQRQLRRSAFYELAMKPYSTRYVLELTLAPPPSSNVLLLDRCARDFSRRERERLALLTPHIRLLRARRPRVSARATESLTTRELEVLRLVASGATNQLVAEALSIARGTVTKHLENAYAKLGVRTRTAAVARAFDLEAPPP